VNSYSQAIIHGSFDDRISYELVGPSDYKMQNLLGNNNIVQSDFKKAPQFSFSKQNTYRAI